MNRLSILVALLFVSLFLSNCKKTTDAVTPANIPSQLARKWAFYELAIQTDAKRYSIPNDKSSLLSDDNVIAFLADGTYSYIDTGKTKMGKWILTNTNQTLTMTDADASASVWQFTAISGIDLELSTIKVDLTKDPNKFTDEENGITLIAAFALASIDKSNGGTVDFKTEPKAKTIQISNRTILFIYLRYETKPLCYFRSG